MAQNEHVSFSRQPDRSDVPCNHCGRSAEIHLTPLEDTFQQGGNFCLACGETVIKNLQKQPPVGDEHGIVYWEGHGWSSDGPFAGA